MTESSNAAEIAEMRARLAALEGNPPTTQSAVSTPKRRVGIWLFFGILLLPYVFVWLLLRIGHSRGARMLGFGWLLVLVVVIGASRGGQTGGAISGANSPASSATDPNRHAKDLAAAEARLEVPKVMKDPSSAQFGQVWGMSASLACGFVNGKNSFGALTGERRFIFALGQTEFDDETRKFAKHWNSLCIDKLLSAAPTGASGKRWGSAPTRELKLLMPPTDEGLTLYIPKAPPAPLEGVPVKEADYGYDHNRLFSADFYIDGDEQGDAVKNAMVKRYGTPLEFDDSARSYKWSWPERKVTVAITYQASTKRTTVNYTQSK